MGTSKGYIAPTTSHWSTAKRAVTAFINNRDFDSKAKAASKYATAMKTDMSTGGSFQSAAARTLGFAQKVASGGLDNALREYNREDLIGKGDLLAWLDIMNILNLQKDRIYLSGLFRIFIQNNLLNLLVLQQIPELL